jgi:hypothetical protein
MPVKIQNVNGCRSCVSSIIHLKLAHMVPGTLACTAKKMKHSAKNFDVYKLLDFGRIKTIKTLKGVFYVGFNVECWKL